MRSWEMSEKICQFLINRNYINEEDKELYTYAIFNLLFKVAPFLIIIPFCIVSGSLVNGATISFCFIFLRKYSGGYHSKTPISCFISSSLFVVSIIFLSKHLPFSGYQIVVFLCCAILSFWLAPAKTRNRELTPGEKKYYKKQYLVRLLFLFFLYSVFISTGLHLFSVCILITLSAVLCLQVIPYLRCGFFSHNPVLRS